jgi:hypothetical protein
MKYVVTADRRMPRADRIRLDVPVADATPPSGATLLDRAGQPLAVPVETSTREEGGFHWATAELALAPLAPGEYVIKLGLTAAGAPQDIYTGIRVTP